MDGAGADDDEQAIICAVQDAMDGVARFVSGLRGALAGREFFDDLRWRSKLLDLADADIIDVDAETGVVVGIYLYPGREGRDSRLGQDAFQVPKAILAESATQSLSVCL